MKIIDLLNKIAKGEEIPKKIKFNEEVYKYHDKEHGYCKHHYDNTYICLNSEYYLFDILNDEVEIIEENKKIEKIENDCEYDEKLTYEEVRKHIIHNINVLKNTINELIDKVNNMENKNERHPRND